MRAALVGPRVQRLDGSDTAEGRAFSVEVGEELVLPVTALFHDAIPEGYKFQRLSISIPFYEESAIGVVLAPVVIDDPVGIVRRMWETNVQRLGSESLLVFYQRALQITKERMRTVRSNSDVSIWDAKAVYKLLEASFLLSKVTEVEVAIDALSARETLDQWIHDPIASRRVERGVGLERAKRLVADLKGIEVPRFKRLLDRIEELECRPRILRLDQFRTAIREIAQTERREAILAGLGVTYTEVQARINLCTVQLAREEPAEGLDVENVVESAINASVTERDLTARPENIRRLNSDIEVLRNLQRDLRILR